MKYNPAMMYFKGPADLLHYLSEIGSVNGCRLKLQRYREIYAQEPFLSHLGLGLFKTRTRIRFIY